jgi:uncharacterized protein
MPENAMDLPDIVLYFGLSAIAGAINAVAGGGTFLVFPVLILNGISAFSANILCTVSLWLGSVSSAIAYKGELRTDAKQLRIFIIISVLGSTLGTLTLLMTPEQTFSHMVPWLLLIATLIFTFGGRGIGFLNQFSSHTTIVRRLSCMAFQFAIAVYGGYFGAGIGIMMLAMLQLLGFTQIHQMNALKTILASTINATAIVIFVFSGKIIWPVAIVMTAGAVIGGYFGARLAVRVPPEKIRLLVSMIAFAMTAYFFVK